MVESISVLTANWQGMVIDFSQHSEPEISFAHLYEASDIALDDETAEIAGQVEAKGTARRSSEIARVQGDVSGLVKIACSRCLQPVEIKFETPFDIDFVTLETYEKSSAEHEIGGGDLSLSVYDGEQIDIDEIVREQILLNLPTHQLCKDSCAGLCEKCGANKNTDACSCETEEIDPRWAALKQLRIKN